jgi:hypothetical protein
MNTDFKYSHSVTRPGSEDSGTTRKSGDLADLQKFADVLDSAFQIPGTKVRVGLDSIIGLIPGIGDAISATISSYLLYQAARLGVAKWVLFKMLGNIVVDSIFGSVPILGDIFDIAFKANIRNMKLMRGALAQPNAQRVETKRTNILRIVKSNRPPKLLKNENSIIAERSPAQISSLIAWAIALLIGLVVVICLAIFLLIISLF